MKITKVKNLSLNCVHIRVETEDKNNLYCYSYGVLVAEIETTEHGIRYYVYPDWDYSNTTMRHVRDFFGIGYSEEIRKRIKEGKITVRREV